MVDVGGVAVDVGGVVVDAGAGVRWGGVGVGTLGGTRGQMLHRAA